MSHFQSEKPPCRGASGASRRRASKCLAAVSALVAVIALFILGSAPATAAGFTPPPAGTPGPGVTPGNENCWTLGMAVECSPKEKPESVLYNALKTDPASIKMLEFRPGAVVVTLNDKAHSQYQVAVTDATDVNNIRTLALDARPPVPFGAQAPDGGGMPVWQILLIVLGILIGAGLLLMFLNRVIPGGIGPPPGKTMMGGTVPGFNLAGKHKVVQRSAVGSGRLTFANFVGQESAQREARRLMRFLTEPQRLRRKGARVPKGILFCGDSGEGKTFLARIIAAESGANFIVLNAPDLIEMYAGVGASRVGAAFSQARSSQGATIIFIDEIDAIGKARKGGASDGNGERDQTLTKLLTEMDGFSEEQLPIIVIAATNRPEDLDKALLRPGRFDRKIRFHAPKFDDLVRLYQLYARELKLAGDVDFHALAKKSLGLSAAHVANVCNEAAILSFEQEGEDDDPITQAHFLESIEREIREAVSNAKGKRFHNHDAALRLADVIGQQDAVDDVMDVVKYLEDPERYRRHGARPPKGVLLTGGPGLGKTLLARALAGEAGVPFFSISASEFVEEVVGRGARHVREFFEQLERNAPAIGFIDEIDAVGKKRGGPNSHDEREQTLNQLLTEMDGFDGGSAIVLLAATNRPETLDEALKRPGRFDREAKFYAPDVVDRLALFQYHSRDKQLADGVDLEFFARNTANSSGADIANFCNEAALLAIRKGVEQVTHELLDEAIMRCQMGAARNRIMSESDKRNTAVHELGHTIVHHVESGGQPFARITIIGRASSGGHFSPMNDDKFFFTKEELLCRIATALGGRKAQQLILGTIDTGAQNDFQQARNIVHQMVAELGMSDAGVLTSVEGVQRSADEEALIASEKKKILEEREARVEQIICENRGRFAAMVEILLERETLSGPEFVELWDSMSPDGCLQCPPEAAAAAEGEPADTAPPVQERREVRTSSGQTATAPPSPPRVVLDVPRHGRGGALGEAIARGIRRLGQRKAAAPVVAGSSRRH